jgi:hypothetical protein
MGRKAQAFFEGTGGIAHFEAGIPEGIEDLLDEGRGLVGYFLLKEQEYIDI